MSTEILESILGDTQKHIDYRQTQLERIDEIGLRNYLQSAMGSV
mgnify:FL=1